MMFNTTLVLFSFFYLSCYFIFYFINSFNVMVFYSLFGIIDCRMYLAIPLNSGMLSTDLNLSLSSLEEHIGLVVRMSVSGYRA